MLFFDGPAEGRGTSLGSLTVRGVPGRSGADDAIVQEVERARAPGEIIVVTADRGLGDPVPGRGRARSVRPSEFFARFGRRRGKTPSGEQDRSPGGRVDVDEWLRYFADPQNRDTEP